MNLTDFEAPGTDKDAGLSVCFHVAKNSSYVSELKFTCFGREPKVSGYLLVRLLLKARLPWFKNWFELNSGKIIQSLGILRFIGCFGGD